jgi:hypothetical protein
MAMIKCPDCATDLSDLAVACPKCGRPMKASPGDTLLTRNRGCGDIALAFILLAAVLAFGFVTCALKH